MPTIWDRRSYNAWNLIWAIIRYPKYKVILSATEVIPPSPWCDSFRIVIRHDHKCILLEGDFI